MITKRTRYKRLNDSSGHSGRKYIFGILYISYVAPWHKHVIIKPKLSSVWVHTVHTVHCTVHNLVTPTLDTLQCLDLGFPVKTFGLKMFGPSSLLPHTIDFLALESESL